MSALPAIEDRVVSVMPASGWWCVVGYRKKGEPFATRYSRTRVAAWGITEPGNRCEPMIASGDGPWLSLARDEYPTQVVDIYSDDDLSRCTCGRRRGSDQDPTWCRDCGAVIAE